MTLSTSLPAGTVLAEEMLDCSPGEAAQWAAEAVVKAEANALPVVVPAAAITVVGNAATGTELATAINALREAVKAAKLTL
jgi:hypothetical protein